MTESIEEISEKYLVLKHADIEKYLNSENKEALRRSALIISHARANEGKDI